MVHQSYSQHTKDEIVTTRYCNDIDIASLLLSLFNKRQGDNMVTNAVDLSSEESCKRVNLLLEYLRKCTCRTQLERVTRVEGVKVALLCSAHIEAGELTQQHSLGVLATLCRGGEKVWTHRRDAVEVLDAAIAVVMSTSNKITLKARRSTSYRRQCQRRHHFRRVFMLLYLR